MKSSITTPAKNTRSQRRENVSLAIGRAWPGVAALTFE